MGRVTRTPDARREIIGITDYLLQHSVDAAVRFLDAVDLKCVKLAERPQSGGLCHFVSAEVGSVRVWQVRGFPNHLIFYRAANYGIDVLRVVHGARDIESVFGGST